MNDESQRPTSNDDREGWKVYWTAQGMPWRTEPEIDEERQRFLAERRAIQPDIEKGLYPFRAKNGSIKLMRADVEWLLATHRYGDSVGPVDWEVEKDREASRRRLGVDLRGLTSVTWISLDSRWRASEGDCEPITDTARQSNFATKLAFIWRGLPYEVLIWKMAVSSVPISSA
jgi:hypothetical protein